MKLYRFLILFILAFTLHKPAQSTHIIGGELRYEYLYFNPITGQGYYRFTLKLYRECTGYHYGCQLQQPIAEFDPVIHVSIYDMSENLVKNFDMFLPPTDTLENNTYNLCLFAPPNVCVEEAIYQDEFFLDPGPFYLTYQRCCRNWDIKNIVLPPCPDQPDVGASWFLTIPDTATALTNSSPYFNNYPPTIICLDDTFKYDHSATDPDGDSLVYELCAASQFNLNTWGAAPDPALPPSLFFTVPYVSPTYSATYPIFAPVDSFKIDPQTGYLTGTPTQEGLYVVAVCVSEYRNGVLLSTNKRDFQFNVAQCIEEVAAGFTAPPPVCDNLTVSFTNTSNQATYYLWDFGIDPLGTGTDISTVKHATFTYPDYGNYTVYMIVNEGLSCADTASLNVYLYDSPIADAGDDAIISLGNSVIIGGDSTASGGTPPYTYLWAPGTGLNDPALANPFATPSDTLINAYTIIVTDVNGCQNKDVDTVFIRAVDARVVIPSAFTPNNDGLNDTLFLLKIGIKELIEFKIFNRWGEVVFETQDINQGWDGFFKGEPQEIGRYVYYYSAETITGDIREGKGDVALLR